MDGCNIIHLSKKSQILFDDRGHLNIFFGESIEVIVEKFGVFLADMISELSCDLVKLRQPEITGGAFDFVNRLFKELEVFHCDRRPDRIEPCRVGESEQKFVNEVFVVHHPCDRAFDIGAGVLEFLEHRVLKGYISHFLAKSPAFVSAFKWIYPH